MKNDLKDATILITGGAGFIGFHVAKMLERQGCRTLLFDCIRPIVPLKEAVWIQGDLGNREQIEKACASCSIDAVMHFAAFIDVGESVADPAKYYVNNVANSLHLFEAMLRNGIKKCIFSSSAAIFGEPIQLPLSETHPCHPVNPYGRSKWMVENILKDYDRAYGLKSICLRYFNAAGADPEGGQAVRQKGGNLIPAALHSLLQGSPLTLFGTDYPTPDGSCIRDYIHVEDIGSAHILALQKLLTEDCSVQYNLGNGRGYSVWEVIRSIEKVTGKTVKVIKGARRPGDVPILLADSAKARLELGWQPRFSDLETMIAHAWNAF